LAHGEIWLKDDNRDTRATESSEGLQILVGVGGRRSEQRGGGGDFAAVVGELVERKGRVLGEAFDQAGVGAFREFEPMQAGRVAGEEAGVGFEDLGAAEQASGKKGARR
jgi:hypothetical protein